LGNGGWRWHLLSSVSFLQGRWIGLGDVKLGTLLGLVFGWPLVLINLWLSVVIGGLVGATLVLSGRMKLTSQIAFGPFLIVGFFITLFYANLLMELASIYLNFQ